MLSGQQILQQRLLHTASGSELMVQSGDVRLGSVETVNDRVQLTSVRAPGVRTWSKSGPKRYATRLVKNATPC